MLGLLEVVWDYWKVLLLEQGVVFCFLYVFIDEVYGILGEMGKFSEIILYVLNLLYLVFKVVLDYLVCVFYYIYGLLVLIINCFNNYGLYYFFEKFILLVIVKVLVGEFLLVYGDGRQVWDWLFVFDYCEVICIVLVKGQVGEIYNVGGNFEKENIEVVYVICVLFDVCCLCEDGQLCSSQVIYVVDCFGYDCCYVIDVFKLKDQLGWEFKYIFEQGIVLIVDWYLDNQVWVNGVFDGSYCLQCIGIVV